MDLFEYAKSKTLDRESPLASRLRPTTLDEVVGQEHIMHQLFVSFQLHEQLQIPLHDVQMKSGQLMLLS